MSMYDRCYQMVFGTALKFMPENRQILLAGEGSVQKLPALLREQGVKRPMVITGPRLIRTGWQHER